MTKPPATPPSSDIEGVHRDRVPRTAKTTIDERAQDQLEAENRDTAGRPDGRSEARGSSNAGAVR